MNNKEYKILPYILYEISSSNVYIHNLHHIVNITDLKMIELLKNKHFKQNNLIKYNLLYDYFKEDVDIAIEFFKSYGIISETFENNFCIDKLHIISNDAFIGTIINNALNNDFKKNVSIKYTYINDITELPNLKVNDFECYICFFNPYNKQSAKSIIELFKDKKDSFLIFSYVYNGNFYIDSLYNSFIKSPCHICQMSYIEAQINNSNYSGITYQKLIEQLYSEKQSNSIETPISMSLSYKIISMLLDKVERMIMLNNSNMVNTNELLEATVYNITDGNIIKDIPIHWELCDCYE